MSELPIQAGTAGGVTNALLMDRSLGLAAAMLDTQPEAALELASGCVSSIDAARPSDRSMRRAFVTPPAVPAWMGSSDIFLVQPHAAAPGCAAAGASSGAVQHK